MGVPIFRFQLSNDQLGTKEITEPDGWKKAKLKFERHPDFHSLVEYFEGDFIFYGSNGVYDGGIDFIKNAENLLGVDAHINVIIDISFDGVDYENIFTGQLDLSTLQELKDNKLSCAIIRNDLWVKFINRLETPVDLKSITDLDNKSISPGIPVDIELTPQALQLKFNSDNTKLSTLTFLQYLGVTPLPVTAGQYFQVDFDNDITVEIKERYTIPVEINPDLPAWMFEVEYRGVYDFNIVIYAWQSTGAGAPLQPFKTMSVDLADFYLNIDGVEHLLSHDTEFFNGVDAGSFDPMNPDNNYGTLSKFYINNSYTLKAGSRIRVYGKINTSWSGVDIAWVASTMVHKSTITILANTIYPENTSEGFLLHDAFGYALDRITTRNKFVSNILGSSQTNYRSYSSDGCFWKNMLVQGLQLRGYSLSEKRLSVSLKSLWEGADPMLNLCLFYDVVNGTEIIGIENKAHAYDSSSISCYIDNAREITRQYDNTRIFKKLQFGYKKWQSEDISGIDDAQTNSIRSTRFEKLGDELVQLSGFIAASLAIETTRRQTRVKSQDYKYDNEVFVIAINGASVSPDRYRPELSENFTSVSHLLNSGTRYNLIHTPIRMLLRWGNYWNGCLQKYQESVIKFLSGEGNYDMVSNYNFIGNACADKLAVIDDQLEEKQDIFLGGTPGYGAIIGFLHLPIIYTIDIDLSWDDYTSIRANRHKAIGISLTDSNHKKFFIKTLEYTVCESKAKIEAWAAEDFDMQNL